MQVRMLRRSISEDLLTKALSFTAEYDEITEEEKESVIQAKRSVLFNVNQTWCKKSADSHFDVTMGSFDGAETCELVCSYLLPKLPLGYRSNIRELKQATFLSTRTAAGIPGYCAIFYSCRHH